MTALLAPPRPVPVSDDGPVRPRQLPTPSVPVVLGALASDLSLVPTLLPRPWWVQALFVAVAAAQTYLLAALVRCIVRALRARAGVRGGSSRSRRGRGTVRTDGQARLAAAAWAALALLLVVSAALGQRRQAKLQLAMGLDPGSAWQQVAQQVASVGVALAVGTLLVTLLLLLARGARCAARVGARAYVRSRSVRVGVMVPVLVLAGCTALGTPATPTQAATRTVPLGWGDVGSDASDASLGPKGREFLRGTSSSQAIGRLTGRPAREPVRVYAALRAGEDVTARAARGARLLERAGGLDRALVVVVVPTGSGWVDPAAMTALETLTGGDVATLAVQYADVPSWIAYLQGAERAERSAAAAIASVRRLLDTVPAERRPRLAVYGESLGALGGLRAQDRLGTGQVDGALWVGVPADVAGLARRAHRRGETVLVHENDPVAAWSADLALGPTSSWRSGWWPVVTFWQATADLAAAYSTPDGFGHRYGSELVGAWRTTLQRVGSATPVAPPWARIPDTALADVRTSVERVSDSGSSLPSRTREG